MAKVPTNEVRRVCVRERQAPIASTRGNSVGGKRRVSAPSETVFTNAVGDMVVQVCAFE